MTASKQILSTIIVCAIFILVFFLLYLGIYIITPWMASINIFLILLIGIISTFLSATLSKIGGTMLLIVYAGIELKILQGIVRLVGWGISLCAGLLILASLYGAFTPFGLSKLLSVIFVTIAIANIVGFVIARVLSFDEE